MLAEQSALARELNEYFQSVVNDFDSGWRDQKTHFARGYYYAMAQIADLMTVRNSLDNQLVETIDEIRNEVEPKTEAPSVVDEIEAMIHAGEWEDTGEQVSAKTPLPLRTGFTLPEETEDEETQEEAEESELPKMVQADTSLSLEEQLRQKLCQKMLNLLDQPDGVGALKTLSEVYTSLFGAYQGKSS
jgi:hypothetical protein